MNRIALSLILIVISLASFFVPVGSYNDSSVWLFEALMIISVSSFATYKEGIAEIKAVFFRPLFIFILAYIIVFFQSPIDYILGYVDSYIRIGSPDLMPTAMRYALIGLNCFLLGYLLESFRTSKPKEDFFKTPIVSPKPFAFLSSLLVFLVLYLVPRSVLMGGYSNDMLTNSTIYNYLASWANTILIAYIVIFTANAKQTHDYAGASVWQFLKGIGLWQNINVLIYSIIILNVGDRGPLIILFFSYYLSFVIVSKKKLSNIKILAGLIVAVMFTSILGETKQYRDNNTIWDRLTSVFEEKKATEKESFMPATAQLAGSYGCLPLAIQMTDKNPVYDMGKNQIAGVVSAVPFAGRVVKLPESTSYRISEYALGANFDFGLGTSCIADFYLDGGLFFIIIGMLLWGIVLRKFEVNMLTDNCSSFFSFCIAFYFLSHVFYIPRSTVLSPFKYGLWMFVVLYLYMKLVGKKR